jgi:hypothetical protein
VLLQLLAHLLLLALQSHQQLKLIAKRLPAGSRFLLAFTRKRLAFWRAFFVGFANSFCLYLRTQIVVANCCLETKLWRKLQGGWPVTHSAFLLVANVGR